MRLIREIDAVDDIRQKKTAGDDATDRFVLLPSARLYRSRISVSPGWARDTQIMICLSFSSAVSTSSR